MPADLHSILALIIEKPLTKKGYLDLQKYLEKHNLVNELDAIKDLISEKFNNDPNIGAGKASQD